MYSAVSRLAGSCLSDLANKFYSFKPKIMAGRVIGVKECRNCSITQSQNISKSIQLNPKKSGFHKVEGIYTKQVQCHNRNPKNCKHNGSND